MTPGARLQASVELLGQIEAGGAPADDIIGGYFRRHRFAGVQDRAAISGHLYAVLRHRAAIDWWIEHVQPGMKPLPRARLFAAVLLVQGWKATEARRAADGDIFRMLPPGDAEEALIEGLEGRSLHHPEMPEWVRSGYPLWLEPQLKARFGDELGEEMRALNEPAFLDLRANRLKGDRASAGRALKEAGIRFEPTRYSPLGMRVRARIPLATLDAFKKGLIEVQDESSQIAALLAETKPGMRVVDFCAGVGGKTLAMAAEMANRGALIACDVAASRLERAGQRLRRAGISNVERRTLTTERDVWVKRHAGGFDRVFVDAPCTGTGVWRRNPDAKWRLTPNDLSELVVKQASILDSAQRLVKPGGRLIYATCSLLPPENEDGIAAFLERHPDFTLLPVAEIFQRATGTQCPVPGPMLHLTPARHGTDGFFVAVMERGPAPPKPEKKPKEVTEESEVTEETEAAELDAGEAETGADT